MLTSLALAGLATATLSLASATDFESHALRFTPAAGARVETRITSTMQMDSNRFEVVMGGQKVPEQFLPPLDVSYEGVHELVARDTYVAVADGAPTKLVRRYETLSGLAIWDAALGEEYDDAAGESRTPAEVEGEEVEFEWSASQGRYLRALVDSDERPEGLDRLDARLDLAGFLPQGEVAVGDVWELGPQLVDGLLEPGGDLGLTGSSAEPGSEGLARTSDGELSARLVSVEDGRALIEFEGEHVTKETSATTLERVPVVDGTATQTDTSTLTLKGRLEWDVRAGRLVTLGLEGTVEYLQETVRDAGQEGPTYESVLEYAGELVVEVEVAELTE